MIEEVEDMNVTLWDQAYETAWEEGIHKQIYNEQYVQAPIILLFPKPASIHPCWKYTVLRAKATRASRPVN